MKVDEIKYSVALLSRHGSIAEYAIGGLNTTGKEKVRTSRDKNAAYKFALPSAQFVARRLAAWGYYPVIVDTVTDQIVERFNPARR
jgi:hypothetical protein